MKNSVWLCGFATCVWGLVASGCVGVDEVRSHHIVVVRVEYASGFPGEVPQRFPILPSREAYEKTFFGEEALGGSTVLGRPGFGSIRQFYALQSGGREDLGGHVLSVVVRPSLTAREIRDRNTKWTQDSTQGEWWVASVIESANEALETLINSNALSEEDVAALRRTAYRVFLFNDPRIGNAWCAGNAVVAQAMNSVGNVGDFGIYAHELGHLLLNQPDRYWERLGGLADWDNMAASYGDFPAIFSTLGRVDAGWSQFDEALSNAGELFVEPLSETVEIPNLVNELSSRRSDDPERLLFEVRRAAMSWEELLRVPRQGVLLGAFDPAARGLFGTNRESQRSIFRYQRPKLRYLDWTQSVEGAPFNLMKPETWAVADAQIQDRVRVEPWTCENGTVLNSLGECLWSLRVKNAEAPSLGVEVEAIPRFRSEVVRAREGFIEIDEDVVWPIRLRVDVSEPVRFWVENDAGQRQSVEITKRELNRAGGRFRWDLWPERDGRTIRFERLSRRGDVPYVRVEWAERTGAHVMEREPTEALSKTWTADSELWVGGLDRRVSDEAYTNRFSIPGRVAEEGYLRAIFLVRTKPAPPILGGSNRLMLAVAGDTFSSEFLRDAGSATVVVEKRVEGARLNSVQAFVSSMAPDLDLVLHQLEWISANEFPELSTPF